MPAKQKISKKRGPQTTIDLDSESAELLKLYIDSTGGRGTKKVILSRLVKWFARAPELLKEAATEKVREHTRQMTAEAIREWADQIEHGAKGSNRTASPLSVEVDERGRSHIVQR